VRISIGLDLFERGYALNFCKWYYYLPFKAREPRDMMETWGISVNKDSLVLRWGHKYKLFWMPWDWGCCVRHEVVNDKGELEKAKGYSYTFGEKKKPEDGREIYEDSYTYRLKSGEIQERTATYYVDEMEWRWRIFHRLYKLGIKLGPKKVMRCISVSFSGEVGERTGSWKGGTLGCGYEMLPGETAQECLRRMERERKF
jgi:hypothetical protein